MFSTERFTALLQIHHQDVLEDQTYCSHQTRYCSEGQVNTLGLLQSYWLVNCRWLKGDAVNKIHEQTGKKVIMCKRQEAPVK